MSSNSTATRLNALAGLAGAKRAVLRIASGETSTHAVLLYGSEGAGKTELANLLAQAWLCRNPGAEGACGECGPCQAFERGTSADLLVIEPVKPSNIIRLGAVNRTRPEDEAYPTPLLEFIRTAPLTATHKVGVIRDAERMNATAANAFLKTLEEPQAHARLVLTSSHVGGVLPTILSRCLAVACELPSADRHGSDVEQILSEGAPGRLNAIRQKAEPYGRIAAIATRLPEEEPERALAIAEEFRQACAALGESSDSSARSSYVEGLRALGTCLAAKSPSEHRWLREVAEAHRRVQRNGGAGIVLDAMFSRMLALR